MKVNQIILGDCLNVMPSIPSGTIPLVVTSPPYGTLRKYSGHPYGWSEFTAIAKELTRLLMDGGVICWVIRNQVLKGREILQAEREKLYFADECGLWAFNTIIGVPLEGASHPQHKRYATHFDYIYVMSKGTPRYVHIIADKINKAAGQVKQDRSKREWDGSIQVAYRREHIIRQFGLRTNVWYYAASNSDHTSRDHGARMAEPLAEDLIISFSKPDDLVFDPMCGVGTTTKMAALNNRKWLGVEVSENYVKTANVRMMKTREWHRLKMNKAARRLIFTM